MPFGFPAYHFDWCPYPDAAGDVRDLIRRAFHELNWRLTAESGDTLRAFVGASLRSWGERVAVTVDVDWLKVESECAVAVQCLDWGKNRANVRAFRRRLAALAAD